MTALKEFTKYLILSYCIPISRMKHEKSYLFRSTMDKEVQIEIKDELIHQDKELQTKKKPIATSSIEKTNILNEEVQTRNESIDQGIILPSTEQRNILVKLEAISIKTDLKTEVKEEKFRDFEAHEQVGIDLITSKDFETPIVKSELFYMKKEVKTEVKQEPLETFEAREQGGIDFKQKF